MTMKAVAINKFVESYDDLEVSNIPDPIPKASEVLVDISHAGLNYVDLLYCRGKHQNNRSLVRPPFVLGVEFSGTVVTAPNGSHLNPGDRVFGSGVGAFAEKIAVNLSSVQRVPQSWSLSDAACMAATAPVSYGALARIAKVQPGETVLIHAAAGGLGVMAVQIAKALGADVIATIGSLSKAHILKKLGVHHIISYDKPDWEKEVLKATGGRGVDVTFDSVGLIEKSIRCSKYAARIVVVGFAGREGDLEKVAANRILLKSILLLGYRFGEHGRQFVGETATIWQDLDKLVSKGLLKPVIYDQQFDGIDTVPVAMKQMAERKVWGKAVIRINGSHGLVKL